MKGKLIFILIVLNLLLFFFVIYKLSYSQKTHALENMNSGQIGQQIRKLEFASESREYKPLFYIGRDTVNPQTYKGKYPVLICCFSVESCAPCYETMLETVIKTFPDYKQREDIIFLSNDLEHRYRDSFQGKKIYANAVKNHLPIEEGGIPFFFVLDSNLKTDLVMYSEKSNPVMVEECLNMIKEKLNGAD